MKIITTFLLLLLTFTSVNAQKLLIYNQGFEGSENWDTTSTCPAYCWGKSYISATGNWGLGYESFKAPQGCTSDWISPLVTIQDLGPDDSVYISLAFQRDDNGPAYDPGADHIELHFMDSAGTTKFFPVPVIHRYYDLSPKVPPMHDFETREMRIKHDLIPITGNDAKFKFKVTAISDNGNNNMFIDDVKIYHIKKRYPIKLINPNEPAHVEQGSFYTIRYEKGSTTGVEIDLTTDGGATWKNVRFSSSPLFDSYYTWWVTEPCSKICRIRVRDANDTSNKDISDAFFQIYNPLGTAEISGVSNLQLFPNPSIGLININYSGTDKTEIEVSVKDLNGKTIYATDSELINGHLLLDLRGQSLSSGVYYLELNDGAKSSRQKLIISN